MAQKRNKKADRPVEGGKISESQGAQEVKETPSVGGGILNKLETENADGGTPRRSFNGTARNGEETSKT